MTPANTQVKLVYDTKLTHRTSCPEIRGQSTHNTVTLTPPDYSEDFIGCWPGTAGVSLRTVSGNVELASVSTRIQTPSVEISELVSSLPQGDPETFSDTFKVTASNLSRTVTYRIKMLAGDADLSFTGCANPDRRAESGSLVGKVSYEETFTVHACNVGGARVFASVLHGNRTIASADKFVRVTKAPPPSPPPVLRPTVGPGKPQNVTYTPDRMTPGKVELSWTAPSSGVDSYQVQQYKLQPPLYANREWEPVQTLDKSMTVTTVEGLATSSLHRFIIRAVKNSKTEDSDLLIVDLSPKPEELVGEYFMGQLGQITLSWKPVPNPDVNADPNNKYIIQQHFATGWESLPHEYETGKNVTIGQITEVTQMGKKRMQVVVSGLMGDVTYRHRVIADSVQGMSEPSDEKSTKVSDESPTTAPSGLTAFSMLGFKGIELRWNDDVANANEYVVTTNPTGANTNC